MQFSKWHALGNSYLVIEREALGRPVDSALAERLCDVRYGIGSDGVVELLTVDGARAEIAIWNPDGSAAEFSGNGSRIAAGWLARRSGSKQSRSPSGDGSIRPHCARTARSGSPSATWRWARSRRWSSTASGSS